MHVKDCCYEYTYHSESHAVYLMLVFCLVLPEWTVAEKNQTTTTNYKKSLFILFHHWYNNNNTDQKGIINESFNLVPTLIQTQRKICYNDFVKISPWDLQYTLLFRYRMTKFWNHIWGLVEEVVLMWFRCGPSNIVLWRLFNLRLQYPIS